MRVAIQVAIIVIGFSMIFSTFFNLEVILGLCRIIPESYFDYPSKMSVLERSMIHAVVKLVIPIIISFLFIYKTKIYKRYTVNFGFWLIAAAVLIYATEILILYFTTFIQGGGPTFVISYMFGYLLFPLKMMLVVGAIKLFMSLKPLPDKSNS